MKKLILLGFAVLALGFVTTAHAKTTHVKGYTKKDGTYVAPHDRTAPNKTKDDNWITKGNINPETGKKGTKKAEEKPKT